MARISPRQARWANAIAGAILLAMAFAFWRDPGLAIRSEFAKQRLLLGGRSHDSVAGDHRWVWTEIPAKDADAPTLVLVHGYTGGKENWYRLARAFDHRYRLVIPDLPGWGQSERKPGADYGYVAQSARLAAFLKLPEVSGGKPVTLVGHSMGGGIVALTAARHPGLVGRVALLDAAGVRFDDNRFGQDVLDGRNPFAVEDEASLQRYLHTVFGDPAAIPYLPWPVDGIYIAQRKRDAAFEQSVLAKIGRGGEAFLPGAEAAKIAQPALLLWCADDQVIDPSAMALYGARIPHASRVLLDGCGHMVQMERPGEVAGALDLLVTRGAPAGPP